MKIPTLIYLGSFSPVLPLVAAGIWRRPLSQVRTWILAWCGFVIVANLITLVLALNGHNNHWLNYVATPVSWAMVLWALAYWQTSAIATLWMRLLVPLLLITWLGIVLALENTQTFSLLAEPFAGLLVLGSAIYTLVARASREPGNLLQQDWLWVAVGLAIESGAAVALPPTAHWLVSKYPTLVIRAYEVRGLFSFVAFVAIARGVTCRTPAWRSGGSSSRVFSRSQSYSSVSSRHW